MKIRRKLADGQPVIGSWLDTASPTVAELMAAAGFDFLTVDAEHSAVDLVGTQRMFRAMAAGNPACAPFVRVPGHQYAEIKRYVDAGALGVICPLVNTPDQAAELVRAVKYPPLGARGVGFCRDNRYGLSIEERIGTANDETVVCVQIEHVDAVEWIDQILAVPGLDAVFIGPYDLSTSLGVPAQFEHPDYLAAKHRILSACRDHGLAAGVHVVQPRPDEVVTAFEEGYRLIAYSLDITMLTNACTEGLARIRERIRR